MTSPIEPGLIWCDRCGALYPREVLRNQGTFLFCQDREACLQRSQARREMPRLAEEDMIRIASGDGREADAARLVGEVRRLRQALIDYGEHDAGCYKRYTEAELQRSKWTPEMLAARVCKCGLDEEIGQQ